jgi:hypothetical protein
VGNQQYRITSIAINALASVAACGKGAASDGATALSAFRDYVAETFAEENGDSECDLRTDVRATQGVAEPWEGVLHADIFAMEKTGKRNRFGWTVDAVFDRAGSTWTCSPTKSKSADPTMKACETLEHFCLQSKRRTHDEKSPPDEAATAPTATLYPSGWEDLPPYGEALFEYTDREWGCVIKREPTGAVVKTCMFCRNTHRFGCAELAITLTSAGTPSSNRTSAATLTFTPSKETGYTEALAEVEKNSKRPPDATSEHSEEAGTARTACWHNNDSTTSIAAAYALAKGTIITVTARDPERCAH